MYDEPNNDTRRENKLRDNQAKAGPGVVFLQATGRRMAQIAPTQPLAEVIATVTPARKRCFPQLATEGEVILVIAQHETSRDELENLATRTPAQDAYLATCKSMIALATAELACFTA